MKIPPVTMTYYASSEDNEERRRQRLLNLLRELSATSPDIIRLNRTIASSGEVDFELCKKILSSLDGKSDRRSLRTKRILTGLMRM